MRFPRHHQGGLDLRCALPALLAGLLLHGDPAPLQAAESFAALDPCGKIHVPIGIPNALDALKTFVEAEGSFSPGFATCGIYFWLHDGDYGRLIAPTQPGVACQRGLAPGGLPIPWIRWGAGDVSVTTSIGQVALDSPAGPVQVVGAIVRVSSSAAAERRLSLHAALRPLGPAGGPVRSIEVSPSGRGLLVDGRTALVCEDSPTAAGVLPADEIGAWAARGEVPPARRAESPTGDGSGALRFDMVVSPGSDRTLGFVCPVLPGRRAARHRWDGTSPWAQFDLAVPLVDTGGLLQPDPGDAWWSALRAQDLLARAEQYWKGLLGRVELDVPDPRWREAFAAITAHLALCMNEGAPDVAVVNFNVFNRDGVYIANILQKAGIDELAGEAIDYLLGHPFNGRVQPEADNPGQILWILGEHWRFTRDASWLSRVVPDASRVASLIRYHRTTPGPHWVADSGLEFGESLPPARRRELKPGACDGYHPEYTEAFDVAGLRAAALLAQAAGAAREAEEWGGLARTLLERYDERFGSDLGKGYGSYVVLWPCRLYPPGEGKAHARFRDVGAQAPESWRYFPLATAHQGLLAGNRDAGWKTLETHLDHEPMRGWYLLDEGGDSGVGGWNHARTTWPRGKVSVALPHGWAMAELHLLLRDCLVHEDGERLVLLAGIPPAWFRAPPGLRLEGLPTHFGRLDLAWRPAEGGALAEVGGTARPPGGFVLRLPAGLEASIRGGGSAESGDAARPCIERGDLWLPPAGARVEVSFRPGY